MAAYQIGPALKADDNRCAGVAKDWQSASKSKFYTAFHARYATAYHLPEPSPLEATLKGPPGPSEAYSSPSYSSNNNNSGGGGQNGVHFPKDLDTLEFRTAWHEFQAHAGEMACPVTPRRRAALFQDFVQWGVAVAIAGLRNSIAAGWKVVRRPAKAAPNTQRRARGETLRAGINRAAQR